MNWIIWVIIIFCVLSISDFVGVIIYYYRHSDRMDNIPKENTKIHKIGRKVFGASAYAAFVAAAISTLLAIIFIIGLVIIIINHIVSN